VSDVLEQIYCSMCQLLGMNCAAPTTDFILPLQGLCLRGGETDIHSHGWGCAIYEEPGQGPGGGGLLRCYHDTLPAAKSPMAQQLVQNDHCIRTYVRIIVYRALCVSNSCTSQPVGKVHLRACSG
jgi:predicted glutamine amidotransferase